MNDDSAPHPARQKCTNCGLVNAGPDEQCRRCGASLTDDAESFAPEKFTVKRYGPPRRSLLKRAMWIVSATLIILVVWYVSLLTSSDRLSPDQTLKVDVAIGLLEQTGFNKESFMLRHVTMFRGSDNWWNRLIGHRDAYAATNFPFEVVTLYPEFFDTPADDRERAAVLLHEARHLLGEGEEAALHSTWLRKRQLGWTADRYRQTKVWDATERLTRAQFPYLFKCGPSGQSDCY